LAATISDQPSVIGESGFPATGMQKKQNRNASRQENQRLSFLRSFVGSKGHIIAIRLGTGGQTTEIERGLAGSLKLP
jgi:hypothetical protein